MQQNLGLEHLRIRDVEAITLNTVKRHTQTLDFEPTPTDT